MSKKNGIPVIDIFAGPGGLGEGFFRCRKQGRRAFRSVLSIEKESAAHLTLTLRAFYRRFDLGDVPPAYFDRLQGAITTDDLFARHPREAAAARGETWLAELGSSGAPAQVVRERVTRALGETRDWVLLGGPPCQAYSLAGRSRNRGVHGYRFEDDHKTTLYLEYLQLIADFWTAVFVMENVKGLLSAKLDGSSMFGRILDDLTDPAAAIARDRRIRRRTGERHCYDLYLISWSGGNLRGIASGDAADFIVRAEHFGVPQSRHRVIVVGVRRDFCDRPPALLGQSARRARTRAIGGNEPSAWTQNLASSPPSKRR